MSCNRQNFRTAGANTRMNPCTANCVTPTGVIGGCAANCPAQSGIVTGGGMNTGCGAPCTNVLLEELPLGMAYVPWQTFGTMYPMQQGMHRGTMFPCLDFDFMGRRCN